MSNSFTISAKTIFLFLVNSHSKTNIMYGWLSFNFALTFYSKRRNLVSFKWVLRVKEKAPNNFYINVPPSSSSVTWIFHLPLVHRRRRHCPINSSLRAHPVRFRKHLTKRMEKLHH